ncbi:hypothetical protein AWM68_17570 [Fictibacillus phosphorivorans]|uniref:Uncharacterized protein n=1 Tax=Fictibacillus phosphorivorans TaxID=1221500 RepID=A0A161TPM6_9BACL|nr:hypothetical protein [Fictibacillus phosphorivorans]KZE67981.1 hypothetical protein AWM68_17570 [Fictibacillus phosphorivorans]
MYAEYSLNARKVEREFQRKVTKRGFFQTAKGCMNYVVGYGKDSLSFKTDKSKDPLKINRKTIRKAISFFFFSRTSIREDMEKFSKFSSAIFAIVYACFEKNSKLQLLKNGLYRLSLLGTRFFASGLERDPAVMKLYKEINGKYVLYNYMSILESPNCLQKLDEHDMYCLIDSGAFTLFNQKKKKRQKLQHDLFSEESLDDMVLEGYARFMNANKDNPRIIGFLPLDCIGNAEKTRENYTKLKALTDAKIYPVWQCTDSLGELDTIVREEHEIVFIGGLVPYVSKRKDFIRDVLNRVTNRYPNVNFHLLGIADELLIDYGIFSADSTAFLNARKYDDGRKVYIPNGERVEAPEHMSTVGIIKQNLMFLSGLEGCINPQLSINEMFLEGA